MALRINVGRGSADLTVAVDVGLDRAAGMAPHGVSRRGAVLAGGGGLPLFAGRRLQRPVRTITNHP
eukprot:1996398-Pyramimonas_sp.AAC.2